MIFMYLPERVLQQFGHMQSIPRHPGQSADLLASLEHISRHYAH
jgi:hypothetical protein